MLFDKTAILLAEVGNHHVASISGGLDAEGLQLGVSPGLESRRPLRHRGAHGGRSRDRRTGRHLQNIPEGSGHGSGWGGVVDTTSDIGVAAAADGAKAAGVEGAPTGANEGTVTGVAGADGEGTTAEAGLAGGEVEVVVVVELEEAAWA